jgi:hypothetical protein
MAQPNGETKNLFTSNHAVDAILSQSMDWKAKHLSAVVARKRLLLPLSIDEDPAAQATCQGIGKPIFN